MTVAAAAVEAIAAPASRLGESPFWHPDEAALYWVDIKGCALHRFDPVTLGHRQWGLKSEPGCMAPLQGGHLLLARRDGLWRFDPATARSTLVAKPPYNPKQQRFNDGKADPQGRMWAGTIDDERQARAGLFCWDGDECKRMRSSLTNANGLGFSPDGRTLYHSDTQEHRIDAFDFDPVEGTLSGERVFARFAPKAPRRAGSPGPSPGSAPDRPPDRSSDQAPDRASGPSPDDQSSEMSPHRAPHQAPDDPEPDQAPDPSAYGGRPDGAAVDAAGNYWVAMFEGQRLLQISPEGQTLQVVALPVRCPTMPCFGGADLRTLYVTTAREGRPEAELASQPLAGCVLMLRVDVPGLPVNFAAA